MTRACYVQASNRLSPGLAFWPIGCDGSDTTWLPRLGPEKPGSFFLSLWKHSLWEHVLWGHRTSCEMSETTDVRKCKWPHRDSMWRDAMWREAGVWVAPSGASRPDRGTTPGNRGAFWMSSSGWFQLQLQSTSNYTRDPTGEPPSWTQSNHRAMSYNDKEWSFFLTTIIWGGLILPW